MSLVSLSLGGARVVIHGWEPRAYVAAAATGLGLLAPLVLRFTGRLQLSIFVLILGGIVSLLAIIWLEGGITSQGMYWLPLVPLLVTVFAGPVAAGAMALLALVMLAFIYLLPNEAANPADPLIHVLSAVLAIGFSWVLAVLYERGRLRSLEDSRRVKDEFVASVSHELRTPLTSVRGALGLLEGGALGTLDERAREVVTVAVRNSDRLTHLIDDLLDLERIQSGQLSYSLERIPLARVLSRAVEEHRPIAEAADVTLQITHSIETPVEIDPSRLQQVLANLLSNAVRHAPPGTTVQISGRAHDSGVELTVTDRGPGIPEELGEQIFEKFVRGPETSAGASAGSGLGLAISRRIIEDFGGRIWFESEAGKGTRFFVRLPRTQ
jgi:signal transduction histidine kinase